MASIWPSVRCPSPQVTTCSTAFENLVPGSSQCFRGFFPRKTARPTGQEEHIGFGQRALAIAPGNFFNDDGTAATAIDTTHGVQQEDEKAPERNEFKSPFGELIISARRLMAARADGGRTLAWSHGYFYAFLVGTEVGVLVGKTSETMAALES